MLLPPDSPEWLEKTLTNLEEKARELIRSHPDAQRAAGYFMAVDDFVSEADQQSRLVREQQMRLVRSLSDSA